MDIFERIINFDDDFLFEKIQTNNPDLTQVFLVSNKSNLDEKYVLKVNFSKSKQRFDLIVKTLNILTKNDFKTAKLLFSSYDIEENKSFFVFEYLGKKIEEFNVEDNNHFLKFRRLLGEFYEITSEFEVDLGFHKNYLERVNFIKKTLNSSVHNKILEDLKENLFDKDKFILCVRDLNPTNIFICEKGFYLLDFDEVGFCEKEFDLADILINFYYEDISFKLRFEKFGLIFEESFDKVKVLKYVILILYKEFIFENKKKNLNKILEVLSLLKNF